MKLTNTIVKNLYDNFDAVITNDEALSKFADECGLSESETKLVAKWLICVATAISSKDSEHAKNDVQVLFAEAKSAEDELSNEFDNVNKILNDFMEENSQRWVNILKERLQNANQNAGSKLKRKPTVKESNDAASNIVSGIANKDPHAYLQFFAAFVNQAASKNQLVKKLCKKYKEIGKEQIYAYIVYALTLNLIEDLEDNENFSTIAQYMDEDLAEKVCGIICDTLDATDTNYKKIIDVSELHGDVNDLYEKIQIELIKAMTENMEKFIGK